ncbi:MAG: hypothetical protein BA066_07085 [Candidatus Korarchaeota archaeon NZ13-K]|nr:MAG: hypothetical protein BA066_07085 [Candidatus Korarchaeota archaeon NZ13-K]
MGEEPIPIANKIEFGKIIVVIHEIVPEITADGWVEYRCAYHISDYSVSPPVRTHIAWAFFRSPSLSEEEARGKTPEQVRKMWAEKFVASLREALGRAVEEYLSNRSVFTM